MKDKEKRFEEIEIEKVRTISIKERKSKVTIENFGKIYKVGDSFINFLETLPDILAVKDFRYVIDSTSNAVINKKSVIFMLGAHVIKCGLSPIIVDLMEKGIITVVAINGAGVIHDTELACWGKTSEDVEENLKNGSFGMASETAEIINNTISEGKSGDLGFGELMGKRLSEKDIPNGKFSILSAGFRLRIPVTVHVAIGTEVVHQHPTADGEAIGKLSLRDFRIFANNLKDLEGGLVFNIGSAVILPEVFLKALTVVKNLEYRVENFTAVNIDMIQHYRPRVNVVERPTAQGEKGISLTGHHEIMIPLLAAALKEKLKI